MLSIKSKVIVQMIVELLLKWASLEFFFADFEMELFTILSFQNLLIRPFLCHFIPIFKLILK